MILKNFRAPLLYYAKLCASFQSHRWIQTGVTVWKRSIRVKINDCFVLCDLEIWWVTLKSNRAPLLCYFKLCALFHSHQWIQNGVTDRKHPIWVKINDFLSPVTLKSDGWPWKAIGNLFCTMLSFVHHFKAISEFKRELQSGNAQFESKSTIFLSPVTLKNNGAPLLSNIKLCGWFHCHMQIQSGVTVHKQLNWVLTSMTLTFDLWPWLFAWTSLLSLVIRISWWCHDGNIVKKVWQTDGRTDWQTDGLNHS